MQQPNFSKRVVQSQIAVHISVRIRGQAAALRPTSDDFQSLSGMAIHIFCVVDNVPDYPLLINKESEPSVGFSPFVVYSEGFWCRMLWKVRVH